MLRSPSVCPAPTSLSSNLFFSPTKSGKQITPIQPVVKLVSTRVVTKDRSAPAKLLPNPLKHNASSNTTSSSTQSVASTSKKRIQVEGNQPKRVKKPRIEALRHAEKKERSIATKKYILNGRKRSTTPPNLVYRTSSRSRSVSAFEVSVDARTPRKCWTDRDGRVENTFIGSEDVIKRLMHSYRAYFTNPLDPDDNSFEPHPTEYPVVTLEYPNDHASERFALLEPKDKDHYNPIMCLDQTLHTIIEYYLTPAQQALVGYFPEDSLAPPEAPSIPSRLPGSNLSLSPLSSLSSLSPMSSPVPRPLRIPSPPSAGIALPAQSSPPSTPPRAVPLSSSPGTTSSLTPLSSLSSNSSYSSNSLLRTFSRAIHTRNGPLFFRVMEDINSILCSIKKPSSNDTDSKSNPLREVPKSWSRNGIPQKVLARIVEETYQRSVGPRISALKRYSAFTSEVYGELMPSFTSDIITATGLHSDSLFLDLGSGVGNVVLQASLQTGCKSFGIEILPGPAELADGQLEQFRMRCRMWGVEAGDVELVHGDMTAHPRVDELMAKADVVLVNNYVFLEELNNTLRPKFLDLKEGAIVVSLKPFAPPSNHLLTERNVDDISSIFDVTSRPYRTGMVSWSSGQGQYYIHRVDRAGYNDCREQFERLHSIVNRGKRARR